MRDLIKSTLRFSWAMSLFGVQQLENVIEDPSQQTNRTASAFDSLSRATQGQLQGAVKDAFTAGDRLQSGVVDTILGALPNQPQTTSSTTTPAGTQPSQQPAAGSASATTQTYAVNSGRLNTSNFVVIGEGLAAGMGDFTLSDETQSDSFPAQMARQMQAKFKPRESVVRSALQSCP